MSWRERKTCQEMEEEHFREDTKTVVRVCLTFLWYSRGYSWRRQWLLKKMAGEVARSWTFSTVRRPWDLMVILIRSLWWGRGWGRRDEHLTEVIRLNCKTTLLALMCRKLTEKVEWKQKAPLRPTCISTCLRLTNKYYGQTKLWSMIIPNPLRYNTSTKALIWKHVVFKEVLLMMKILAAISVTRVTFWSPP